MSPCLFAPVAPIDNVYGTLGLVNALTTQQYSAMSKLREEIEGFGSYTFFAPSNDAWDLLDAVPKSTHLFTYSFILALITLCSFCLFI